MYSSGSFLALTGGGLGGGRGGTAKNLLGGIGWSTDAVGLGADAADEYERTGIRGGFDGAWSGVC